MRATMEKKRVETTFGTVAYLEAGAAERPPIVFVHGIPTSSYLWRDVMRFLQRDYRCLAPDLLGLGDSEPREDIELHMEVQAEMVLEFAEKLGAERFVLVAHDQGGAAAQVIASRLPERLLALVLADVVCHDNWPVPAVARLQSLARVPLLGDLFGRSGLAEWIETRTGLSAFRRGVFDRQRIGDDAIREYLRPLRGTRRQRAAFRRFLLAGHPRHTMLAVAGMRRLTRPTLVLWAADDAYISPSWGKTLFEEIPGAQRFELVPFCGHFWPEERPAEFASHIEAFLEEHLGVTTARVVSDVGLESGGDAAVLQPATVALDAAASAPQRSE